MLGVEIQVVANVVVDMAEDKRIVRCRDAKVRPRSCLNVLHGRKRLRFLYIVIVILRKVLSGNVDGHDKALHLGNNGHVDNVYRRLQYGVNAGDWSESKPETDACVI